MYILKKIQTLDEYRHPELKFDLFDLFILFDNILIGRFQVLSWYDLRSGKIVGTTETLSTLIDASLGMKNLWFTDKVTPPKSPQTQQEQVHFGPSTI